MKTVELLNELLEQWAFHCGNTEDGCAHIGNCKGCPFQPEYMRAVLNARDALIKTLEFLDLKGE